MAAAVVGAGAGAPEYDLVVVGGGAAGVCASIDAAGAGLRTLVLEAFPEPGGAAATSGGGCCMVGTPLQAARGIEDGVELALSDWIAWGRGEADADWARLYLERSCQDLYLWLERLGVEWDDLHAQEGNTVPRWHHPRGAGAAVMRLLIAEAGRLGVEWRCGTPATRLLIEGGNAAGVETEGGQIRSRATLVATGGFANDPAMLRSLVPDPGPGSRLLCGGARQATGRGHRLLAEAGARFEGLDRVWIYCYATPDFRDPVGSRGIAVRGVECDIWVNAAGRRFHDETLRGGGSGTQAVLAQRPATCWSVFDRVEADRLRLDDPQYRTEGLAIRDRVEAFLAESPFVHRSETVEGLAAAAGLPPAELAETVRSFNGWVRDGLAADPDQGRPLAKARALDRPPFFAVQFFPMARKNLGGVRTDLGCRVQRPDGTPIAGLYAAGEVAGMAGGHINGRAALEGTMLGPSLFSGRVAGRAAAADLGRGGLGRQAAH